MNRADVIADVFMMTGLASLGFFSLPLFNYRPEQGEAERRYGGKEKERERVRKRRSKREREAGGGRIKEAFCRV